MEKSRVKWVEGNSRRMLVLLNETINTNTDTVTVKLTGVKSQREYSFSPNCIEDKVRFTVGEAIPADDYVVEVKVVRRVNDNEQIMLSRKRFQVSIVKYDEDLTDGADAVLDAKAYIEGPMTTVDDMTEAEKEELATRMGRLLYVDEDGWMCINDLVIHNN